MKELKFRGLTKENKFVYGYYFLWKKRNKNLHIIGEGVQNGSVYGDEVDPETISQDTGLKDSTQFNELSKEQQENWLKDNKVEDWKGKEIFEGDIVEIIFNDDYIDNNNEYIEISEGSIKKGLIIFDGGGFFFKLKTSEFLFLYDICRFDIEIKILGNIYQNRELLEINK